jgi:glycosyltransferase involved in cell wall biosynthesis
MKIVLAHNSYQQRGGEDATFEKERDLLRSAGHDVVEYRRSNFEVQQYSSALAKISLAKDTIWSSDTRREFHQLLLQEKPQIVHVYNTFAVISPSIFWACHDVGIPVVQTLQNFRLSCPAGDFFRGGHVCEECKDHNLLRGLTHACYRDSRSTTATVALMLTLHRWNDTWTRMVDRYIALTDFASRKFTEADLPPEKLTVKPNFVAPDPAERQGPGDYILYVGRLSREKGLSTLLSAWQNLQSVGPLRVVGDGPMREQLQAEAARGGVSNFTFVGRLQNEEVIEAIKGARFLVFPSECYENCPTTILEAFACGVPVIASRLGAMLELVDNGRTGLHFHPGDAADLAEKVSWAWSHPEESSFMGHEARAEYESKYTAEKNYSILMQIYESLLRGSAKN